MTAHVDAKVLQFSAPVSVFLNITRRCNLRCTYCSADAGPEPCRMNGDMTDSEYLALLGELIAAKVFRFVLTGGEPLMRRTLVHRILATVASNGMVQFNTNGTMIDETDIKALTAFPGKLQVVVSLDGPTEDTNALTRGVGSFQRTLLGIGKLIHSGIRPNVNCVLNNFNRSHIGALVDLLKTEGLSGLGILHLVPLGRGKHEKMRLALTVHERYAFNHELQCIRELHPGFLIYDQDDGDWFSFERSVSKRAPEQVCSQQTRNLLPCSAGVDQCNILPNGVVTPCNGMPDFVCGNVREESFLKIWRESPGLNAMRQLRTVPVDAIEQCRTCRFNLLCRGGCRAKAFFATGSLTGMDPTCPYAVELEPAH